MIKVCIVLSIIQIFVLLSGGISIWKHAYKKGQIDAHNGIIKYRITSKSDGSSEWEYIYSR